MTERPSLHPLGPVSGRVPAGSRATRSAGRESSDFTLGETAFTTGWAEGAALPQEEAVAYSLEEEPAGSV